MDRNDFIVVTIRDFESWLLDSVDKRLVSRIKINCKLSCGTREFVGVEVTEPVVAVAYVSE